MDYTFLLGSIENLLGKSHKRARDNHAFHCPFCNHHKPKLEIKMSTNEQGQKASVGIYLVLFEYFNSVGEVYSIKKSITLKTRF